MELPKTTLATRGRVRICEPKPMSPGPKILATDFYCLPTEKYLTVEQKIEKYGYFYKTESRSKTPQLYYPLLRKNCDM